MNTRPSPVRGARMHDPRAWHEWWRALAMVFKEARHAAVIRGIAWKYLALLLAGALVVSSVSWLAVVVLLACVVMVLLDSHVEQKHQRAIRAQFDRSPDQEEA